MQKIKWKMKGFGKGINPAVVAKELKRISDLYEGALIPENIVNESKSPASILHNFFEWDNRKAADNYRLQQARNLINNIQITVISHGESRYVGAFEVVNVGSGRAYKSIEVMTKEDIVQVKQNILTDLEYLRTKLSFYNEFKPAIPHITRAIKSLNKRRRKKK